MLGHQLLAAFGNRIIFGFAIIFGQTPLRGNSAVQLQTIKGRVERPFFYFENFIGQQMNGLGDGVPMHRTTLERVQDKEIEGPLEQRGLFGFGQWIRPYGDLWEVCQGFPKIVKGKHVKLLLTTDGLEAHGRLYNPKDAGRCTVESA